MLSLRKSGPVLWLLTVLLLAVPVFGQELAENQHLRIALHVRDVNTLDPAYNTLSGEKEIIAQIFNGLLRTPYGKVGLETIEGDLAESWDVSEDGLVWTFYLRKGVQWHRGYGEVTADDVKFTFERMKDPNSGSPWQQKYANIQSIEVIDPYTVRMTLAAVDPFFELKLIPYHGGHIVPRKAVEELGTQFAFQPVGSGPFVFQSYQSGRGVILTRNEQYFRGAPILETVEYLFMPDDSTRLLALQRGEVDMARGILDRSWVDQSLRQGLKVLAPAPAQQLIIAFNMSMEPMNDIRVRRAFAHAINNQEIIDLFGPVLGGEQKSPLPPGYFGYTEEGLASYPYDPDKARALLAEAGYPDGLWLGRVFMSESHEYLKPMQVVQEHLRQVGIDMQLQVVDHPTYHARIRENLNPIVLYGGVREPVADTILTEFYHSKSIVQTPTAITNFSHYGSVIPGIDELLDEARSTRDRERQLALYAEAQRRIMEDLPAYPLALNHTALAYQPNIDLGYDATEYESLYYAVEINEHTRKLKR